MTDFSRYNPPGVYTESIPGPQIGVQPSNPTAVAIYGLARGYQTDTETILIPADATEGAAGPAKSAPLRQKGVDTSTLTVTNVATGVLYVVTTDYTIVSTPGPSGTVPNYDTTYQLKRVDGSSLTANTSVSVSYHFTDEDYYTPVQIFDYDDVVSRYGAAFDVSGAISSELTLAAGLAFTNGAPSVFCSPVANSGSPQASDYSAALARFEGVSGIAVVVCANGNTNYHSALKSHVTNQSASKFERRAIVGTDGATTAVSSAARISAAQALSNVRVACVSPSAVDYFNSALSKTTVIGGQYLAAAVAGIAVSQNPALPLTRKQVNGFQKVNSAAESQKNTETQAGLMVIDNNNQNSALRVRHGVTTDVSTLINREWSILGQQDSMAYRIRSYFDNDGLIGSIITDTTMANVKASAQSALQSLVDDGIIQSFQNLKVRQNQQNLDVVEIGYEWRASLPMNYIVVRFALTLTDGSTTDTTGETSV